MDDADERIARLTAELAALQELIGVLEDTTFEQTKRLQESEARQKAILEAAPDCILTLNAQGEIISTNGVLLTLFGRSLDELRKAGARLLFFDDRTHATFAGLIEDALDTSSDALGESASVHELRGRRSSGETFPLSVSVRAVAARDRVFVAAFLRDISELKRVDTIKNEFISTVSHELRTPLTSILGSVQLILGGIAGDLPEDARSLLEIAQRNGKRLTLLISDILDLDKIESGTLVFDFEVMNLEDLTWEAARDNHMYADRFGVTLATDSRAAGAEVRVDAARYGQVVANLLSNAIKFSPRGGTVTVRVERHGTLVRLSVIDQGPGIRDEFRQKIFERFAQGDSSDTRRVGGTGLGLSISKSIVERMGGRISFASELGVGTTFHVDLPCVVVRDHAAKLPPPAAQRDRGRDRGQALARVLVCEDEDSVAQVLVRLLKRAGYDADVARSAAIAKELLAKHTYAAMTLDLMLPDQHGIAFLQELRAREETKHLPVVIVSGALETADGEFDIEALNIVDWQPKPVDTERLTQVLRQSACASAHPGIPRLLYAEDEADLVSLVRANLDGIADVHGASSVAGARRLLRAQPFDVVLLDLTLSDGSGLELLPLIQELAIPLVIYSVDQVDTDLAHRVAATLVKSRTTPAQLAEIVTSAIRRSLPPGPLD
jgi:PAS domain S-box-containing protein